MAANNNKPVHFGVTLVDPAIPQPALRSPPSNESYLTTGSVNEKEMHDTTNPFSAFYKHPEASRERQDRTSLEGQQPNKSHLDVAVDERDLEAGLPLSAATTTQQPKVSVDGRVKECTMWPSRQAMIDKKKINKRARGCHLLRSLSPKQRLWVKIVIALVIVAAAVGLGVGISKAVGGGVWSGQGQSKPIPNN